MAGSQAEREQTIDALKAAFVQGRLTMDEFDARIGQTFTSRTYAELAAVTADIPDGLPAVRPPRREAARPRMNHAVRWGASGFVTPVLVAASLVLGTLSGGYMAVGLVIAVGYFLVWLSIGTEHALGMALHVVADGQDVRPMRAHPGGAPHAGILYGPAGFADAVAALPVRGLSASWGVTRGRPALSCRLARAMTAR